MAAYTNPSVADFKAQFSRDFPYGGTNGDLATVQDQDITNALNEAGSYINPCLFNSQSEYSLGFLRLSAHYMVMNLRASSQGLFGQYEWMVNSKSVGSVAEGVTIPDRILSNPMMAMLTRTNYGAAYLYSILPQLTGQMFAVYGGTNY